MGRETQGFAALPPEHRALAASIGSLTHWSRLTSPEARREANAPARRGLQRRWEREADPDGVLSPAELAAAVQRIRKAHYARMTLASAQSRARKKG